MLTLHNCLPLRSTAVRWYGLLWKALTTTATTTTTTTTTAATPRYKSHPPKRRTPQNAKYYLRSPSSLIYHYYKELGSINKARIFVNHFPKLKNVSQLQLEKIIKLIKSDGHSWKEVVMFRDALLLTPSEYKQRMLLLHSINMARPSLYYVLGLSGLMERPAKVLNENCKSLFVGDPFQELIMSAQGLDLPQSVTQEASKLIKHDTDNTLTLKQIFLHLLKHYLASRFSEEPAVVGSFLESVQYTLLWKPLYDYPAVCDVLIDCLQLTFAQVQQQPRLFNVDPQNVRAIVNKFPDIGGTPIQDLAATLPKLFQLPAYHIETWINLLNKLKVQKFKCNYHMVALFKTGDFTKVEEKINILKQLQEWEIIMLSDDLFEILRSHGSVKRLLNITEAGDVILSLRSAIKPSDGHKKRIWRRATPEIISYVSDILEMPTERVREVLKADLYTPYGINNTKAVLKLLMEYGFTQEQIMGGVVVLNLEADMVEQTLREFHTRPEAQPFDMWMRNPYVLHLLAYCVTKDVPNIPFKK